MGNLRIESNINKIRGISERINNHFFINKASILTMETKKNSINSGILSKKFSTKEFLFKFIFLQLNFSYSKGKGLNIAKRIIMAQKNRVIIESSLKTLAGKKRTIQK